MPDAWDDGSDAGSDAWDVESDDAALEAKLGLNKLAAAETSNFDDDEDLNLKDKAAAESRSKAALKSKGKALAEKKAAEAERVEEEELARKVMQLEMEREARMTEDERKLLERQRVEESDASIANDLFGGIDDHKGNRSVPLTGAADKIVLVDLKDHLKFAKKISACFKVSATLLLNHLTWDFLSSQFYTETMRIENFLASFSQCLLRDIKKAIWLWHFSKKPCKNAEIYSTTKL
jgi:hypothetical protein